MGKVKVEMDENMAKFLSGLSNEDLAKFTSYKEVNDKSKRCPDECLGSGSSIYGMFYQLLCPAMGFYDGYKSELGKYSAKNGSDAQGGGSGARETGPSQGNPLMGAKKPAMEDYLSGSKGANGMPGNITINTGCIQGNGNSITNPVYNGNGMGNAYNGKGMNYTIGQGIDDAKMKAYVAEMLKAMAISKKASETKEIEKPKYADFENNVYEWMYEDGPMPVFQKKTKHGPKGILGYMQNRPPLKMSDKMLTIYEPHQNTDSEAVIEPYTEIIIEIEFPEIETLDIYNDGFSDAYKTEKLILPEYAFMADIGDFFSDKDYGNYFNIEEFNWYGNVTY